MDSDPEDSMVDAIHVLTQILEKCYEHDIKLHILFVDFKRAFDNIIGHKLRKDIETPRKLIRLINMTMESSQAKIITRNGNTNNITIFLLSDKGTLCPQYCLISL